MFKRHLKVTSFILLSTEQFELEETQFPWTAHQFKEFGWILKWMCQKRRKRINWIPRKLPPKCITVSGSGKYVTKTLPQRSWKFPWGAESETYHTPKDKAITAQPSIQFLWRMSTLRACYSHTIQILRFESLIADHLCIYLFLLAWHILGVNDPTIYWFNALQFSSLTFMFFHKLQKGSVVTHPKGLRKVKIIWKILRKEMDFKKGIWNNA